MRWFSSRGFGPPTIQEEQGEEQRVHRSLALSRLMDRLRDHRRYSVMDLGPACSSNFTFFSDFSTRIFFEDLYTTLTSFDFLSPEDGFSYDAVYRYLLPYGRQTRVDLIISWDLFNYLNRDEFFHLIRYLGRYCHRGTLLFALIYTGKVIPEQPGKFRIKDKETLVYDDQCSIKKEGPRYEETDLNALMPGFQVGNSFLLRNGIKEYIFSYDRRLAALRSHRI